MHSCNWPLMMNG